MALAYGWTLLLTSSVLFYDPTAFGQVDVPNNVLLVTSQPALLMVMNAIGLLVQIVVGLAVLALVVRRYRATTPPGTDGFGSCGARAGRNYYDT